MSYDATTLQIPTQDVIKQTEVVATLNSLSTHITNTIGVPITTWHFDDFGKVLQALVVAQQAGCSFRFSHENGGIIMQYGEFSL